MDFYGIHFADPLWLWALAALPLVLLLLALTARAKRSTLAVGHPVLVAASHGTLTFQGGPWLIRLGVIALCLLAAARPQLGRKKVEQKQQVTDIFVALDVSTSMITTDLKPNRITAAKHILSDFLEQVKGARVGLEVFAGRSFTQCPLTTDLSVVKQLLDRVSIYSVQVPGTAIGDGLASCINRLEKGSGQGQGQALGKEASNPVPDSQAIVLLTDGENNQGLIEPELAARLAARQGISLYIIGVGGNKWVPEPVPQPDGSTSYALDQKGDIIMTRLAEGPLKELARLSNGKFYRASDNRTLTQILDEIAHMEKHDVVSVSTWEYNELAPKFLLGAFLLLALDFLLGLTVLRTLP